MMRKCAFGISVSNNCAGYYAFVQLYGSASCDRPIFDVAGFHFLQTRTSDLDVSVLLQAIAEGLQLRPRVLTYDNVGFYVRNECNTSRDVICQECQTCGPASYVNNTCGANYGNYRLDTQCALCPADFYCPGGSISQAALECPANVTSVPGSDALADCLCDPGFYRSDLACVPCAEGTFSTGYKSSLCAACDPGKFSAAVGATSGATCVECPAGTYETESGMAACLECPQSTWQNESVRAERARKCTACPAHSSHGVLGMTDIFTYKCAAGFWKRPVSPGFACSECFPGHFCPGADKLLGCAFNTFATGGGVEACTPCAPFSKATANASLTSPEQCQCSVGASGAFHSGCTPCPAGYFQARDGTHGGADAQPAQLARQEESCATVCAPVALATVCVACAKHTFQNATGSIACDACIIECNPFPQTNPLPHTIDLFLAHTHSLSIDTYKSGIDMFLVTAPLLYVSNVPHNVVNTTFANPPYAKRAQVQWRPRRSQICLLSNLGWHGLQTPTSHLRPGL
jgi:hypothetical protein